MDDQKPQDNDDQNQPVSIPINDITPPPEESVGQKISVISGDGEEKIDEPENLAETPETAPAPIEEPLDEAPQNEEQLSPVAAPPEEENEQNTVEQQPVDELKQASSAPAEMGVAASQMNSQKHPHRNNKKLAMIVTIATALILAGTAVFVYMSANKNTDSDNNSESTQINGSSYETEQKAVTPATLQDIDQSIAEVDESFSALDDEADFREESLSDDTLGL